MLNTAVKDGGAKPTASNVDAHITETGMGRLTSFDTGTTDHMNKPLQPPKVMPADITTDVY
jgi:hypothetical protein